MASTAWPIRIDHRLVLGELGGLKCGGTGSDGTISDRWDGLFGQPQLPTIPAPSPDRTMAYLTFLRHGVEIGRCPLASPVVIGRAAECNVCVHDILLSRRHCRIQPTDTGWMIIDLNSKNGTHQGRERIEKLSLQDGYELTVGKTTIRYHVGELADDVAMPKGVLGKRPTDPFEVLAGTVTDFDAKAALRLQQKLNMPSPKPVPPVPAAYGRDDVFGMLNEIASSSWDSIYETASRPRRPLPDRVGTMPVKNILPVARPRTPRDEWGIEVLPTKPAPFAPPAAVRPVRPKAPRRQRKAGWVRRTLGTVGGRVKHWVAPQGAIRLF